MKKLHRWANSYPGKGMGVAWCGRVIAHDRIVTPEDVRTDRECKLCRRAHDAALARNPDYRYVHFTR